MNGCNVANGTSKLKFSELKNRDIAKDGNKSLDTRNSVEFVYKVVVYWAGVWNNNDTSHTLSTVALDGNW